MCWQIRFAFALSLSIFFGTIVVSLLAWPFTSIQLMAFSSGIALALPFCWSIRARWVNEYPATMAYNVWYTLLVLIGLATLVWFGHPTAAWVVVSTRAFITTAFLGCTFAALSLIWHHRPFLKRSPYIATISVGAFLLLSILSINSIELRRTKPIPAEQLLGIKEGFVGSVMLLPTTGSYYNNVEFYHSPTTMIVNEGCRTRTRYMVVFGEGAFIFPQHGIVQHYSTSSGTVSGSTSPLKLISIEEPGPIPMGTYFVGWMSMSDYCLRSRSP